MRQAMVVVFVALVGAYALCADTGPEAPFFVTSPTGFGPIERGTIDSLQIDLGSTKGGDFEARIEITGTTIMPVAYKIEFNGKTSHTIDLSSLESDDEVLLSVEFYRRGSNTKITTATREIDFAWGFVGAQLDSASSLPFTVGTPRDLTLQLTPQPASAPIDSFAIALVSPDTSVYRVLYSDTVIPSTFLVSLTWGMPVPLGSMISVYTLLDDDDESFHETLIDLPIEPKPMTITATLRRTPVRTNNYGLLRNSITPVWPTQRDTVHVLDLPDSTIGVSLYAALVDGSEVKLDSIDLSGTIDQHRVSLPITVTDIDVRTTHIGAKVYVKSIPTSFDVAIPINIDIGRPRIRVLSARDTAQAFHFRQWNPHNNATATMSAGIPTTLRVEWPLKSVDSVVVSYLSSTRQMIHQTILASDRGDSSATVIVDPRIIPPGTAHLSITPFSNDVVVFNAPWDTTIALMPSLPAFLFDRNSEFTGYGIYDVNDILTVADLMPTTDSLRLVLKDADASIVYLDSTATTPSTPFAGDVIFGGQAAFTVPTLVDQDTVRTVAMWFRSAAIGPFTIMRWKHETGNELAIQCQSNGTLHATFGSDSVITTAHIRDGAWHQIAVVIRDTAIALFYDASLQGTMRQQRWHTGSTARSMLTIGDGTRSDDTLFSVADVRAWIDPLTFAELQRSQVESGQSAGALYSYSMQNAEQISSSSVLVRDEIRGSVDTIDQAQVHGSDLFAFSRFVLMDIGAWPKWAGQKVSGQRMIDAYLTQYDGGVARTDTVSSLIQIQSVTLTPDSLKCAKSTLFDSRLRSSEGWGPFNAFEPVTSIITYEGGYPWSAIVDTREYKRNEDITFSFLLFDARSGETAQRVDVVYTPKMILDSAKENKYVVIQCPKPMMMDRVGDTTYYVTVLTSLSINGLEPQCLDVSAPVQYLPPPPLPVAYSQVGPFRQAKIWQGEHVWNTFTAYTEETVETGVVFLVTDASSNLLHTVNATKSAPGVWTAKIDMADCEPPLAVVVAYSLDGTAIKRTSTPMHFSITPNRPAWLQQRDAVLWQDPGTQGERSTVFATVSTGAGLSSTLPKHLALVGGFSLWVMPSKIKVKLLWDPKTNDLDVSLDGGYVQTDYAASTQTVASVQTAMTVINNSACFGLTVLDGVWSAVKYALRFERFAPDGGNNPIGNINLNLQSADSTRVKLDHRENLDVVNRMTQTVELYYLFNTNLFQSAASKVFDVIEGSVEDAFEGPIQFIASAQLAPTISGMGRLLVQDNVGTDDEGKWVPRGTLPVVMGDLNGPTMTGAGVSIDLGVSLSIQVLKGAASLTVYLTGDIDFAGAFARTADNGQIDVATLKSMGVAMTVLVQTAEVWGAVQQTIYGPTSFLKYVLAGDDLRDLYPAVEPTSDDGEAVQSSQLTPIASYPVEAITTEASPMPHTAQHGGRSYSVWIDQDHTAGAGTLNLAVRAQGRDSIEKIMRVAHNTYSMISPHVTPLTDTTCLVVWRQIEVDRSSASGLTFVGIHSTSDVYWSVVNTERGVVADSGRIRSADIADPSLKHLVIESHPRAMRLSDTAVMVVWMATDTAASQAAVLATELRGSTEGLRTTPVRAISIDQRDHRAPHVVPDGRGGALATWVVTTIQQSHLYQSQFDGANWSAPSIVEIGDVFVNQYDVADNGEAMVVVGMDHRDTVEHEVLMVIPRAERGLWDVANARHLTFADDEMILRNPKIAVRGDSAVILVRSQVSSSAHVNRQYHRLTSAVVDLRDGRSGHGVWVPTDSLSMIHDHDLQWEDDGLHVIVQEHLPIRGLHTNATLVNPIGAPTMNLAMHTISISRVITGVDEQEPIAPQQRRVSTINMAPIPAMSTVQVTTMTPYTNILVYTLDGAFLYEAYHGEATVSTSLDVNRLSSGVYLMEVINNTGERLVTLLRIANE